MGCIVHRAADGKMRHSWFRDDVAGAAQFAIAQDDCRCDVYASCATYIDEGAGRRADNVEAVRALWFDIDCGGGKEYAEPRAGRLALTTYCDESGISHPDELVSSGNGLHAWWLAGEDLDLKTWKRLAELMKARALAAGLHIDKTVTADAARILRIPGTHNRKDAANPKPVRLLSVSEAETAAHAEMGAA